MTVKQDWIRAAHSLIGVMDRLPRERWDAPALGTWSLRELVGHATSAGVREVIVAAGRPAPVEDITSPEAYYALVQTVDPDTYATAVAASDEDARRTQVNLSDAGPSPGPRGRECGHSPG